MGRSVLIGGLAGPSGAAGNTGRSRGLRPRERLSVRISAVAAPAGAALLGVLHLRELAVRGLHEALEALLAKGGAYADLYNSQFEEPA